MLNQDIELPAYHMSASQEPTTSHATPDTSNERTKEYHKNLLEVHKLFLSDCVMEIINEFTFGGNKRYCDDGMFSPKYERIVLFSHINWIELTEEKIISVHEIITGRKWTSVELKKNRKMLKKTYKNKPPLSPKVASPVVVEKTYGHLYNFERPEEYLFKEAF